MEPNGLIPFLLKGDVLFFDIHFLIQMEKINLTKVGIYLKKVDLI